MSEIFISGKVLCDLLTLSRQRIDTLVREGVLKRHGKSEFKLIENVKSYLNHLRESVRSQSVHAADNRIRDARARDIEIRTQQRLSMLVPLDAYEEMIDGIAGLVRSEFAGLATVVTRDLVQRRIIEREVNARLHRIAEYSMAQAIRLETVRGADEAKRTNDAGRMGSGE